MDRVGAGLRARRGRAPRRRGSSRSRPSRPPSARAASRGRRARRPRPSRSRAAAGAEDAHRDLAAVRHEQLLDRHRCGRYASAIRSAGLRRLLLALAVALAGPAQAGAGTVFVVNGHGWGHGVGMSQYGARGYAQAGWGYERILAHYYPGRELRSSPSGRCACCSPSASPRGCRSGRRSRSSSSTPAAVRRLKRGTQNLGGEAESAPAAALRRRRPPVQLDAHGLPGYAVVRRQAGKLSVVNGLRSSATSAASCRGRCRTTGARGASRAVGRRALLRARDAEAGRVFDLYADTRSQVYGGIPAESSSTNRAVAATAGRVLLWHGRVATTFYHSTSGGRTVRTTRCGPAAHVPYLVSSPTPTTASRSSTAGDRSAGRPPTWDGSSVSVSCAISSSPGDPRDAPPR